MAARSSLAEKYASQRGQVRSSFTNGPTSSPRVLVSQEAKNTNPPPNPSHSSMPVRLSLAEKYEQHQRAHKQYDVQIPKDTPDTPNLRNIRESIVPGAFRSPIQPVLVESYSSRRSPPPQLFKSNSPYSAIPPVWRQKEPANPHTQKVMKRVGPGKRVATLARRLTGMFRSHSSGSRGIESDRARGPESDKVLPHTGRNRPDVVRNYYTVPSSCVADVARVKSSSSMRPLSQETRSEVDEVDLAIRERKHQQEQRRLAAEKRALETRLSVEQRVKQRLAEDYERRLYLQQKDYESQLEHMRRDLEAEAESVSKADSKSGDVQSSPSSALYSENEALRLRQQQLQDEVAKLNLKLAEKEALLAAKFSEVKPVSAEKSQTSFTSIDLDGTEADIFLRYDASRRSRGHSSTDLRPSVARFEQVRPKSPVSSVVYDLKQMKLIVDAFPSLPPDDKQLALATLDQCQKRLEIEPSRTHLRRMARISRTRQFLTDYDVCAKRSHEDTLSRYGRGRSEGLRHVFERVGTTLAQRANRAARGVRRFDEQLLKLGHPEDLSSLADVMQYVELLGRKASATAQHRELTEFLADLAKVTTTLVDVIEKVKELEGKNPKDSANKLYANLAQDPESSWAKKIAGDEKELAG